MDEAPGVWEKGPCENGLGGLNKNGGGSKQENGGFVKAGCKELFACASQGSLRTRVKKRKITGMENGGILEKKSGKEKPGDGWTFSRSREDKKQEGGLPWARCLREGP